VRADLLCDRAAGPDRYADNNEVGAFDRSGIGLGDLVGNAKLSDTPACLLLAP